MFHVELSISSQSLGYELPCEVGSREGLNFQSQLPIQEVGPQKGNREDKATSLGGRRENSVMSSSLELAVLEKPRYTLLAAG